MLDQTGNVVFTKRELNVIAEGMGLDASEIAKMKPSTFVKEPGRRGRPAAAFDATAVKTLLEQKRKQRRDAVQAAMNGLIASE